MSKYRDRLDTRDDQKRIGHFSYAWVVALNISKFCMRWKSSSLSIVHAKNEGDTLRVGDFIDLCIDVRNRPYKKCRMFWKNKGMWLNFVGNSIILNQKY